MLDLTERKRAEQVFRGERSESAEAAKSKRHSAFWGYRRAGLSMATRAFFRGRKPEALRGY